MGLIELITIYKIKKKKKNLFFYMTGKIEENDFYLTFHRKIGDREAII